MRYKTLKVSILTLLVFFAPLVGALDTAEEEKACKDIEEFGLDIDQGSQSTRLRSNGWV